MKTIPQRLSTLLAVFAMGFVTLRDAPAQEGQPDAYKNYPNRPVRVIVTTAAGGASDYVVRPIAQIKTNVDFYVKVARAANIRAE